MTIQTWVWHLSSPSRMLRCRDAKNQCKINQSQRILQDHAILFSVTNHARFLWVSPIMHNVEPCMYVKKSRKELKHEKSQIKHGVQALFRISSWMSREIRDEMEIMCVQLYHKTLKHYLWNVHLLPQFQKPTKSTATCIVNFFLLWNQAFKATKNLKKILKQLKP